METTPNDIIRTMVDKESVEVNELEIDALIETISRGGDFDRLKAVNLLCRVKRNLAILGECIECETED